MLLCVVRQIFPIADFENQKNKLRPNGEWDTRLVLHTANVVALGFLVIICFGNMKGNFFTSSIITIMYSILVIVTNKDIPQ